MTRAICTSLLVIAALVTACGDPSTSEPSIDQVVLVDVSPTSANLGVGETKTLTVLQKNKVGAPLAGTALTWTSSATAVATVSSGGVVTAMAKGLAVITATNADGLSGGVMITVEAPVASLDVISASTAVIKGGGLQLTPVAKDADGNVLTRPVTYSTSSAAVATVSGSGLVTGVAPGTATITATVGAKTKSVDITVVSDQLTGGSITAGREHSCGLTVSGKAYCWGLGFTLGQGKNQPHSALPIAVPGGPYIAISAGQYHTIALGADGVVYAWGQNQQSQIGNGSNAEAWTPIPLQAAKKFKSIDADNFLSVALDTDGKPWVWGTAWGDNGGLVPIATVPTPITTNLVFEKLSSGGGHVLALTSAGDLYGWGTNEYGELGNGISGFGTTSTAFVPVGGGKKFKTMTAAPSVSFAIDVSGKLWAWGANSTGYFVSGTGSTSPTLTTPTAVIGDRVYSYVEAGVGRVFAITTDGTAYGWGTQAAGIGLSSNSGALGIGGTYTGPLTASVPTEVQTTAKFTAIVSGVEHTIGLSTSGEALGWGSGSVGQAGTEALNIFVPQPTVEPTYLLSMPSTINLEQGETKTVLITLKTTPGGFTTKGPKQFKGSIPIKLYGATTSAIFEFDRTTLSLDNPVAQLRVTAPPTSGGSSFDIAIGPDPLNGAPLGEGAKVSITKPAIPGQINLSCPTGSTVLPTGFQCMTNSAGQHVPGKYSYPIMHGSWVDEEAGVCLTWNSDGTMGGKYKAGYFGSAKTLAKGEWGVIVRHDGVPEGTATQWYVFSESADAQLQLLGFDSTKPGIIGWHFTKQSACPTNW